MRFKSSSLYHFNIMKKGDYAVALKDQKEYINGKDTNLFIMGNVMKVQMRQYAWDRWFIQPTGEFNLWYQESSFKTITKP